MMMLAPSHSAARTAAKAHPERFPVGAQIVRVADRVVLGYVVGSSVEPPGAEWSPFDPRPREHADALDEIAGRDTEA